MADGGGTVLSSPDLAGSGMALCSLRGVECDLAKAPFRSMDCRQARDAGLPGPRMGEPNKQAMKILVLSHMFPRFVGDHNGIFVFEQVQALRARNIDVRVLSGTHVWLLAPWRAKELV